VNVSTSNEFIIQSNVYKNLWVYFHLMRASNRRDIQNRIKLSSLMSEIASLSDSANINPDWNKRGAGMVKTAIEKYYNIHVNEFEDLVKKTVDGLRIECRMMDKYIYNKPFDYIGGIIRQLVEKHLAVELKKNDVSDVNESIATSESTADVTVVHFNPKPEEPSQSTDDNTFKHLSNVFWRSQRQNTIINRKKAQSRNVDNMRQRIRDAINDNANEAVKADEVVKVDEADEADESVKKDAVVKLIDISISSSDIIPEFVDIVISTTNTGSAIGDHGGISIYMPIDNEYDMLEGTMQQFFAALFSIAVSKKVHVYASSTIAPFIRDVIREVGHTAVHDNDDARTDDNLKVRIASIVKTLKP
jgi:hypothetical protein